MFASKEWFVRLCHFHNPFAHTSQCRDDQLHLAVSMFKSLVVSIGKGNDVRAPLKESRKEEPMSSNTLQITTKL